MDLSEMCYDDFKKQFALEKWDVFDESWTFDEYWEIIRICFVDYCSGGVYWKDGKYVAEDKQTAFQVYMRGYKIIPKEVVIDAYPKNLLRLGECFMYGWGCEANRQTARELLKDAVEVFELQVGYGRCYAKSGLEKAKQLYGLLEYVE